MPDYKSLLVLREHHFNEMMRFTAAYNEFYRIRYNLIGDLVKAPEANGDLADEILEIDVKIANLRHSAEMARIACKSAEVEISEYIDQEVARRDCLKENLPEKI
jgi:hypothetical protein